MGERTRVGAYVLCIEERRLLMCRIRGDEAASGRWTLPGGGVRFGEEPAAAAVREVDEETGLLVELDGIMRVTSSIIPARPPDRPEVIHAVGIVYRGHVTGGSLRDESGGSTDRAAWIAEAEARRLPLVPLGEAAVDLAFGPPVADPVADPAAG